MSSINKLKNWYGKYERPISSASLVGGFIFDVVTLKRVDLFWENVWVVGHLVIVAVCILIINSIERGVDDDSGAEALAKAAANPSTKHFWLVNILQFFFGGILSTYLVFYFRSSEISSSWFFLLILAISFWANEALKRHFVRLIFQISLLFLSIYAFAIFIVPVILHKMNNWIFLLSGIISLIIIGLFLLLVKLFAKEIFTVSKNALLVCVGGIYFLINILFFLNIIPPIPLSLKDSGVFHSLRRNSLGNYVVMGEKRGIEKYFVLYQDVHKTLGESVFVYSAIFSPPMLNTNVIHQWQSQDKNSGMWVTRQEIILHIVGGREAGFRTYSERYNVGEGKWRVNVLTRNGQVIDRIRLNVILVSEKPKLLEEIK